MFRSPARALALVLLSLATSAHASMLTLNFGDVFSSGSVAPTGPGPYLTAVFDDHGTTGSVTLTMTVEGHVGSAAVDEVYFNLDPLFNATQLNFSFVSSSSTGPDTGTQGNNGIFKGTNQFQADGDGLYDIYMNFPPPPGNNSSRWTAGEVVVYNITSSQAITASSFDFLSAPGGGAAGPFTGAAHFLATGLTGASSAWVGVTTSVVPVPAAVWLFGSGLLGLAGIARRRH